MRGARPRLQPEHQRAGADRQDPERHEGPDGEPIVGRRERHRGNDARQRHPVLHERIAHRCADRQRGDVVVDLAIGRHGASVDRGHPGVERHAGRETRPIVHADRRDDAVAGEEEAGEKPGPASTASRRWLMQASGIATARTATAGQRSASQAPAADRRAVEGAARTSSSPRGWRVSTCRSPRTSVAMVWWGREELASPRPPLAVAATVRSGSWGRVRRSRRARLHRARCERADLRDDAMRARRITMRHSIARNTERS